LPAGVAKEAQNWAGSAQLNETKGAPWGALCLRELPVEIQKADGKKLIANSFISRN
jgi:hypothetical protein